MEIAGAPMFQPSRFAISLASKNSKRPLFSGNNGQNPVIFTLRC